MFYVYVFFMFYVFFFFHRIYCIFLDEGLEEAIGAETESVISNNTPCKTKVRVTCLIFKGKV